MTVTAMPQADPGAPLGPPPPGKAGKKAKKGAKVGRRSRKKLVLVVLVLSLVIAAGWYFVLKPGPAAEQAPEPGQVVALEPIQVNLSAGHYLRLGIALQMTKDVKEAPDGSKALDTAIALFSGRSMEELVRPGEREKLKERLAERLAERYEGEVMDVYFTDFVTQ